jgi:hypothetical protein
MTTGDEQGTTSSHRMKDAQFLPAPHVLALQHALQQAQ